MKKVFALVLTLSLILATLVGCGSSTSPSADSSSTITVGASSTPHAEILEQVKDTLAAQGYTLNIVIYDDYVLPNTALEDGTLDANYFQHTPYLDNFNQENGTHLVSAARIHYEPFGLYGNGVDSLSDVPAGATILVPADGSNETRALFLLQQEGLITLKGGVNATDGVTEFDIVDNGGYAIVAVQADTIPAQLQNSDAGTLAVINGNYALQAGLDVNNALATEDASGEAAQTYVNIVACRADDERSEKITALANALQTDSVKAYINDTYNGAVVTIF